MRERSNALGTTSLKKVLTSLKHSDRPVVIEWTTDIVAVTEDVTIREFSPVLSKCKCHGHHADLCTLTTRESDTQIESDDAAGSG